MKLHQTMRAKLIMATLVALVFCLPAAGQQIETNVQALLDLESDLRNDLRENRGELYQSLIADQTTEIYHNSEFQLIYVKEGRYPRFYGIENLTAAETVSTDEVWPGGSTGFSLTGSGTSLGEFALWDAGGVRTSHQEFGGRVTQIDSPGGTHYHSTHCAGTLVASGVVADAQGMSYQAPLAAYDWDSDEAEMASAAASGLNVSSHSYGYVTGWRYYSSEDAWYWFGDVDVSETEDYGFGFYGEGAELLDQIAYDAPYYTILKSAGNDRNDYGPGPGGDHYYWNPDIGDWEFSTTTREADGGPDGYDSVSWKGTAKNILTIGAIDDIPGGYNNPSDVEMSSFSGWGPVDDGRIKPDLVANGVGLYSTMDGGNNDYASLSGTSMSTPNAAGSLNLLVRHYEATHAATPLASTMKAVLIHTADEAGSNTGPDYEFGWGLMNTSAAAEIISADQTNPEHIREETLANGDSDEYTFYSDGTEPLRVTLAWTDPPGTSPNPSLNPTTLMLVNDLDLRLEKLGGATWQPYTLDPLNPTAAAAQGDNYRDNSEMVYLASPDAGNYRITVSHKGSVGSGQTYSLVQSTVGQAPSGACCFIDGHCEYLLEAECQTGDWTALTACDPNPCPQPSGACCELNGTCTVTLEADCQADWTMFEVCDPNPCPQPFGACCELDGTCTVTQEADCQTDWTMFEVCDPNPCPQPFGACCELDGTCTVTLEADCQADWTMFEVCDPNPCPQPSGACCFIDGHCEYLLEAECQTGDWTALTTCDPNPCQQPSGACCFPDGHCEYLLEVDCQTGAWTAQTACDPNPCQQPTGACCHIYGTCIVTYMADCEWEWIIFEVCDPNPCVQPGGACCYEDGHCEMTHYDDCAGDWSMAAVCDPNPCPQPTGACCSAYGTCTVTHLVDCEWDWIMFEVCDPNPCVYPNGACCYEDGHCEVTIYNDCPEEWHHAEACDPNPCPQPTRACCFDDESCEVLDEAACISNQGVWQPDTDNCDPNPCPLLAVDDKWLEGDGLLSARTAGLFRLSTVVFYNVDHAGPVTLTVHDITGRVIRLLVDNEMKPIGRHQINWNGTDDNGHELISGVYFYRIKAPKSSETRSVVRMK